MPTAAPAPAQRRRRHRPDPQDSPTAAPTSSTPASCSPTPGAIRRFAEHEVVLPVVVITELEGKRHHPELGYFARVGPADARRAARRPRPSRRAGAGGGGGRQPAGGAQPHRPDVAALGLPARRQRHPDPGRGANLADEGYRVTLVSKDLPLRIKASAVGLDAEEYRAEAISDSDTGYTGMAELDVARAPTSTSSTTTARSTSPRRATCRATTGLVLLSERGTALGRVGPDKQVHLVRGDREAFGIHGRSRRAAGRPRAAARPRGRHRLPRRPRRHRQVGDGAVRRARGGPRARPAPEGRGLPPAVRRRRPGARLPARLGVGEDVALGARRSSTPSAR